MSRPFQLYRLQQIDSQLDSVNKRLGEVEAALEDDRALRLATSRAESAEGDHNKAHKALRKAEDNVRQQTMKIEQSEASLYGGKVRNPKELQDLQNEVAALKRYLSVLEDRQLEAMLAEEEAAENLTTATNELEKARTQSAQKSSELLAQKDNLLKDHSRFSKERGAATSSIPDEDMKLYMQLRKQRRGIAVAKVTDKACSACGSILNSALLHAAHSATQINTCDTCGRILYV